MVGYLARSMAGHDKGTLYIIIEETDQYLLLANGSTRTIEKPKRKNKKHVAPIKIKNPVTSNEAIKHSIREYRRNADV